MAVPCAEMDLYCRLKRCKRHKVSPHRTQLFRCLANSIQFSLFTLLQNICIIYSKGKIQ